MEEIFLKIRYFESELSKSLQKVNFIYVSVMWNVSVLGLFHCYIVFVSIAVKFSHMPKQPKMGENNPHHTPKKK